MEDLKIFEYQKFHVADQKRDLAIKQENITEEVQTQVSIFNEIKKEESGKYDVIDKVY